MAKCRICDYPYVGNGSCPSCGEKSPTISPIVRGLFVVAICMGIFYYFANSFQNSSNDYSENKIVTTTIDDQSSNEQFSDSSQIDESISQDPNISDERQLEIVANKDYYIYNCRECGEQIKWVGSYTWSNEDETIVANFDENTDLSLVGDDRVDTEMYHEEGYSNRGIFCSRNCSEKNFYNWLVAVNSN